MYWFPVAGKFPFNSPGTGCIGAVLAGLFFEHDASKAQLESITTAANTRSLVM
jgi:hypothetical protein